MNKLRTVDLFCGGGGLSRGLCDGGLDVVAAFDHWQPAVDFYNCNMTGHSAYSFDLADVDAAVETISKLKPVVIAGGPPCQDFSSAGKRDEGGGRADLTISYAKIVTTVRPQVFIMENVDRALKCKTYRNALKMFADAGYHLAIAVLDASLCGVPQKRKRAIVVGTLREAEKPLTDIYRELQSDRPMTVRDYLGDTLGIEFYYRHPRSYARRGVFSIDEPSPTIRGVNRPIPKGYQGHPGDATGITTPNLRELTTKERSLIQTFPEEWNLYGKKSDVEQIIGNAVPVKLAEFIGKAVVRYCEENSLIDYSKVADTYEHVAKRTSVQQFFAFEQASSYSGKKTHMLAIPVD